MSDQDIAYAQEMWRRQQAENAARDAEMAKQAMAAREAYSRGLNGLSAPWGGSHLEYSEYNNGTVARPTPAPPAPSFNNTPVSTPTFTPATNNPAPVEHKPIRSYTPSPAYTTSSSTGAARSNAINPSSARKTVAHKFPKKFAKASAQVARTFWLAAKILFGTTAVAGFIDGIHDHIRHQNWNPIDAGTKAFEDTAKISQLTLDWSPQLSYFLSNPRVAISFPFEVSAFAGGFAGCLVSDIVHVGGIIWDNVTQPSDTHNAQQDSSQPNIQASVSSAAPAVEEESSQEQIVNVTADDSSTSIDSSTQASDETSAQPVTTEIPAATKTNSIIQFPTAETMQDNYPSMAADDEVEGTATVQCMPQSDGTLTGCTVISEDPKRYGFGKAAIRLTEKYMAVDPQTVDTQKPKSVSLKFTLDR